jgi:hypothetical protein
MVNWARPVPFDEVVGYWLNYEYSSRGDMKKYLENSFKEVIPYILNIDLTNAVANAQRRRALYAIRSGILTQLQIKTEWWDAEIEDSDTSQLNLINSGDWRNLTDGTLKPLRAAQRIASERELRYGAYTRQVSFILKNYVDWEKTPTRFIIVGPKAGPYTVIDGVHRIVGLFLYHYVERRKPIEAREIYFGITDAKWNPLFR